MSEERGISRVGVVGLGTMGAPMARNLAGAGYALTLRDADAGMQASLAGELAGAEAAEPSAFAEVQAVVLMLPTGAIVREVLLGWGLADALPAGAVAVDMSSSVPTGTRELGAELLAHGVALVDAPVSGGPSRAQTGELAIMAGADDEAALARVLPLLEVLGARIFRTGGLGTGHAMKALNNGVAASTFAVSVEALLAGRTFGLDPAAMLEVMNASTGRNFNTEHTLGPHVLDGAYGVGFALALMSKDVGIAADLADELGVDAPTLRLMRERWSEALAEEGAADFTTAARHWAGQAGIDLATGPA
jgi:3-hydroxyisobutyrate dehydrogenase